jgi:hypothetical protein
MMKQVAIKPTTKLVCTYYEALKAYGAQHVSSHIQNGGTVEKARAMAAHESSEPTELYNRTDDEVILDEIERIAI